MSGRFSESVVEQAALAWLESLGWQTAHGPDIAPDMPAGGRRASGGVVRAQRLCDALLPKLISGELRLPAALRDRAAKAGVKDAERLVVEAP